MKLYAYLNYAGSCEEAFRFYEKIWAERLPEPHVGATFRKRRKHVSPEYTSALLHARMEIGETVLMGSDVVSSIFQPMRSVYLSLFGRQR